MPESANIEFIDGLIIVFYLIATLVMGVVFSRFVKSSGDFFLAGKALPFWAIGMSIVVSDIGAIDMVSGAGAAYKYGLAQANFDWIGSVPALIIAGFIFVPFYWRSGVCTLPEFLGRRYGPAVRGLQAVIWLGFLISMLAVMLYSSDIFLQELLGIEPNVGVWLTVVVVSFYTVMGGLAAVVFTDVVQTVVMFVGAAALLGASYWQVGGWSGLVEIISKRGPEFSEHFQLLLPHNTESPYPWSGIVLGLGIVLSTAYFSSNQAVIQRVLGARSEWHAKAAMVFAGFLKLLVPVLIILPGLTALALHPDLEKPDSAMPRLVVDLLPPGAMGLMFAAFIAALMSSVDSYLNSATTIIVSDGYRPFQKWRTGEAVPDRHCLYLGRILTFVLIVAAGLIAPYIQNFETIYTYMQTMFSLFQGPTLALLVLGIFWRRTSTGGAVFGLVTGVLLAICLSLVGGKLFPSDDPFLFVAFATFLYALVATAAVSLITPAPRPEQLRGLVWGSIESDPATQAMLRERMRD